MHLRTAKNRVYSLLEKYPKARDDDKILTAWYWWTYQQQLLVYVEGVKGPDGKGWAAPLHNISKLDSEDKLSRIRRKIQNEEGRFFPTDPKVAEKRGINMEHWRQWAATRKDHL